MFRSGGQVRRSVHEDDETQDPENEDTSNFDEQLRAVIENAFPEGESESNRLTGIENDIGELKRSIGQVMDVQNEILVAVKKIKRAMDAEKFDMGKCCHTENINQLLAKYYIKKGKLVVDLPEKERELKAEFTDSPTGLTCEELTLRFKRHEGEKFSYWKTEERRRVLGMAGYGQLLVAPTSLVVQKLLQLMGQKTNQATYGPFLQNELILTRKYVREIGIDRARAVKHFWDSFYAWKTRKWANGINGAEWMILKREDRHYYPEE